MLQSSPILKSPDLNKRENPDTELAYTDLDSDWTAELCFSAAAKDTAQKCRELYLHFILKILYF